MLQAYKHKSQYEPHWQVTKTAKASPIVQLQLVCMCCRSALHNQSKHSTAHATAYMILCFHSHVYMSINTKGNGTSEADMTRVRGADRCMRWCPPTAEGATGMFSCVTNCNTTMRTWSILLMNVWGWAHLGVSIMNAIIVGKPEAKASVIMAPEADHVKISIWPGVSTMTYFKGGSRCFSQRLITYST